MSEFNGNFDNLPISDGIFKDIKFFVSGEVDDKVINILKNGGAERMNYFSDYVTHLICGEDSEETDVSDANDIYEIPAVTPRWIYMCVRLNRLVSTKPYFYDTKKLFSNMIFCLSKVHADRNVLWALITYHGGLVQMNLTHSCTHLVTTSTNSLKYAKAFSLSPVMVIVTPDWIMECIKNKMIVQSELYHPSRIIVPRIIKHESTTSITGFEPEPLEMELKTEPGLVDSTQALLDKLKQRMPWNQPVSSSLAASTKDIVPPNVVAPSFTGQRLPVPSSVQHNLQQRALAQQLIQQQSQSFQNPVQSQPNLVTATQIARAVVHHTPQGTIIDQSQPQLVQFSQHNQAQMQNRLHQQRVLITQQMNKSQQHMQFTNQQMMQRNQLLQQQLQQNQGGQMQQGLVGQLQGSGQGLGQLQGAGQLQQGAGQLQGQGQMQQGAGQVQLQQGQVQLQQGQVQIQQGQVHMQQGQGQMQQGPGQMQQGPGQLQQGPGQLHVSGQLQQGPGQMQQGPGQLQQGQGQLQQGPGQLQVSGQLQQGPGQLQQVPGQLQQAPGQLQHATGQLQQGQGQLQQGPSQMQQGPGQLQQGPAQLQGSGQLQQGPVQLQAPGQLQQAPGQLQTSAQLQAPGQIQVSGQLQGPGQLQQAASQLQTAGQLQQASGQLPTSQQLPSGQLQQSTVVQLQQGQVGQLQQGQVGQLQQAPVSQIQQTQVVSQVPATQMHLGQPQPQQLNQMVGQTPGLIQRTQIGLAKTPVGMQQLLVTRQQQFVGIPQQQNTQFPINQQQQQQHQHLGMQQAKLIPNQFVQQQQQPQLSQAPAEFQQQQQQHQFAPNQQFVPPQSIQQQQQQQQQQQPAFNQTSQQQIVQNQFVQNRQQQFGLSQPQLIQQQQQQQQQIIATQQQPQLINQNQQLLIGQQQQLIGQQISQPQQQQQQQHLITQAPNQLNKPIVLNQQPPPGQQLQASPSKPIWQQQQAQPQPQQQQQQQQQQPGIRHPATIIQQQGPRVQWSPNQQQAVPQRQYIHLDAQTHQQLQQMAPEQRALFIAKIQKQRQVFLQQQRQQLQMQQQQRGGHVLIRSGPVPQGLNPQQQMQWLQQQAKQQGVMLQQPAIQQQPQQAIQTAPNLQQHPAPGLSPIQQNAPAAPATQQFAEQNQLHLQRQQQLRLQQLQLQREQSQKAAAAVAVVAQPPIAQPNVIRPIGQPQTAEPNVTTVVESNVAGQQQLVVNAKTKTALANMLSIRLQSGGSTIVPTPDAITEPSAAGTLRLMTAQHNAALNSNNRPQELLALQQRRAISGPNGELIRPAAPATVQQEPPKLQYSPRNNVPVQHRQGPFYGHNPNLKLPPDLFLLGCIFVVVELDRFLEESFPDWHQQIEKHGGEVEKQYCSRVTHVLCETQRHGVVMQALRDYKRCVTLYWLSDVMKRKQVLPPWTALHLPTMYLDTTPASKHLISLTGFANSERNRIKDMIKYIGATFTNYFSKHNTLLIAAKAEGPKYMHAKKWNTPVANVQWLTDVLLGNFSALNQMEHIKYQQFQYPPIFTFEPSLVPNLMHAWKMPINISQESYERVKRSASPVVLPKKVKKMKIEHQNDENEDPNDQTPQSLTHRILFSMFAETDEFKRIVKELGGSLAKSHTDCTHLVMPYLARTNKLLFSVCLGIPILPESWLRDSHAANKFLDHSNYSLDTKDFNSEYKCDFNQTLSTRNRNKLFEGKFFYITPSVFPSKRVISELIRSCGGVVERHRRTVSQIEATNINSPYSYIILTHANDLHLVYDVLRNKKDQIQTVCNVELIYSAILKQTFEIEPYAVRVCQVRR